MESKFEITKEMWGKKLVKVNKQKNWHKITILTLMKNWWKKWNYKMTMVICKTRGEIRIVWRSLYGFKGN